MTKRLDEEVVRFRNRLRAGSRGAAPTLLLATVGLAWLGCDQSHQQRIIETYRAAAFSRSHSSLARGSLMLSASVDLGRAYEVTAKRLEYVSIETESDPPIDENGELIRPRVQNVELEVAGAASEAAGAVATGPGGRLAARLPSRVLRAKDVYYRWVVEYTSGGDRLTMRKSEIFRTSRERAEADAEDERVTF